MVSNEKAWNISRIIEMWLRDVNEQMLLEKWCLQTCSTVLPQTLNLLKNKNKQKKTHTVFVTHNKQSEIKWGMLVLYFSILQFLFCKFHLIFFFFFWFSPLLRFPHLLSFFSYWSISGLQCCVSFRYTTK